MVVCNLYSYWLLELLLLVVVAFVGCWGVFASGVVLFRFVGSCVVLLCLRLRFSLVGLMLLVFVDILLFSIWFDLCLWC